MGRGHCVGLNYKITIPQLYSRMFRVITWCLGERQPQQTDMESVRARHRPQEKFKLWLGRTWGPALCGGRPSQTGVAFRCGWL